MSEEATTEVRLACRGRTFQNGKMYVRFAVVDDPNDPGGLWALGASTRRYQTGVIYKMMMNEGRTTASFKKEPYEDMDGQLPRDEVAALRISSDAAEAAQRKFKDHKKVSSIDGVLDVLKPLRCIYHRSDRPNRRLIELAVIDYLRRSDGLG